jgi:hypothetical protein
VFWFGVFCWCKREGTKAAVRMPSPRPAARCRPSMSILLALVAAFLLHSVAATHSDRSLRLGEPLPGPAIAGGVTGAATASGSGVSSDDDDDDAGEDYEVDGAPRTLSGRLFAWTESRWYRDALVTTYVLLPDGGGVEGVEVPVVVPLAEDSDSRGARAADPQHVHRPFSGQHVVLKGVYVPARRLAAVTDVSLPFQLVSERCVP